MSIAKIQDQGSFCLLKEFAPEALQHIFSFVTDKATLARIERVCKNWTIQTNQAWKEIFFKNYPEAEIPTGDQSLISWKALYKRQYLIDSNIQQVKINPTLLEFDENVNCQLVHENKLFLGFNSCVQVLDLESEDILYTLSKHQKVQSLCAGEGKLVSSSFDDIIRVSNIDSDANLLEIRNNDGSAAAMCICVGKIFSARNDYIQVREIHANQVINYAPLKGHTALVLTLCASRNKIFSGSIDKTIRVWNALSGAPLQTFTGHEAPIFTLLVDANRLFSSSADKTVRVWNTDAGGAPLQTLNHDNIVTALSASEGRIFSSCGDTRVRIRNIEKNYFKELESIHETITALDVCRGKLVVNYKQKVMIWDLVGDQHYLSPTFRQSLPSAGEMQSILDLVDQAH